MEEHHLAKVGVAGSNPVSRSKEGPNHWPFLCSGGVAKWPRRRSAKPLFIGSTPIAASMKTPQNFRCRGGEIW